MRRRTFMAAAGAGLAAGGLVTTHTANAQSRGATILLAHGAWSAAWAWKKMRPLMAAAGHQFITPTYTGLGEREHLATPSVDLETHVQDILGAVLKTEPDWTRLPNDVSPAIRQLLRLCLEKDVNKRRRDVGVVRLDIEEALAVPLPTGDGGVKRRVRAEWLPLSPPGRGSG